MNKKTLLLLATTSLPLTACTFIFENIPGIYTLDIHQGNMVDQSMVDQLRPGMTKRQVVYIMGSPMLSDTFHERRWDYVYTEQLRGEERLQKRLSLYFNGDNLAGLQGDFRPSAVPAVKESAERVVELPKREFDRSMWQKIRGLFVNDADAAPVATTPTAKP
jgi:outer membrane protein assembly factor BamE